MAKMSNDQLIELARAGKPGPLLKKLGSGKVATSAGTDPRNGDYDGTPGDTLFYDVLAADLPADVLDKCYDAVGAR